jgi:hypothetical protein
MSVQPLTVRHAKELNMLVFSLSMMLVMILAPPVGAEERGACSLLTSGDIEAATGNHVSGAEPLQLDDIVTEPNRAMKVLGCLWGLSNQMGKLTVTWFRGPLTEEEIAQLIKVSKNNADIENMKRAHYWEVSKEFAHAWCATFTPSTAQNRDLLSTCAGGVNRQGLALTLSSPTTSLTIDQAKTLLDKAGERAR